MQLGTCSLNGFSLDDLDFGGWFGVVDAAVSEAAFERHAGH